MQTLRILHSSLIFVTAFAAAAQTGPKRPLNHRDYDGWRTLQNQVPSRDGKFLAYSLFPEEGDGELVVRNLATGKELREPCGTAPPVSENSGEEPAEGPVAVRGIRIVFTHDNAFVVASAFPSKVDTEKAKKERKRPDEMPRNSMIVVSLATMSATRVADVASFQTAELGDSYVAYLRGPKPAGGSATSDNDANQHEDQGRGGRGGAAGARRRGQYGSDLVLRDLRSAHERTFADVAEFSMAKDSKTLLYAVASKTEQTNGVYAAVPGSDAAPATLLSGKGQYTKLTWDLAEHRMAFLSDRDDQSSNPRGIKSICGTAAAPPRKLSRRLRRDSTPDTEFWIGAP